MTMSARQRCELLCSPGDTVYLVADGSEEGLRQTVQGAFTRWDEAGSLMPIIARGSSQYQDTLHAAVGWPTHVDRGSGRTS
jgi:hypothetical protein